MWEVQAKLSRIQYAFFSGFFFFGPKQTKSAFYVMRTGLTNASIKREEKTSQMAKRIAAVNTEQQPTQVSSCLPLSEAKYRQPITTSIRRFRRRLNCPSNTCYRSVADSYNLSPNTVCPKALVISVEASASRDTNLYRKRVKKKKKASSFTSIWKSPQSVCKRSRRGERTHSCLNC